MKLFMPTKVHFEKDAVRKNAKELAALGTKAMIVTGNHSSEKNGSLQDVKNALEEYHVAYVIFNEIEENPSIETAVKAATVARHENVDFFIGVGGGSPMDASKAIALLAKNPDMMEDAATKLYTPGSFPCYPVAAVPTTCGTGSEATQYSILTIHDKHTKKSISHYIFPKLALVDAKYLKTASYAGMVSTCVDALAHAIESYLNTNADTLNRLYAKEALQEWGSVKECLMSENAFSRMMDSDFETFMHASVLAGMAIAHTGTSIPHGLSYALTYELGIPHGKAVGVFLSAFLKAYEDKKSVSQVLDLLGFEDLDEFVLYMERLLGKVELPHALWVKDVEDLMANPAKLKNYPYEMTKETLMGMYEG